MNGPSDEIVIVGASEHNLKNVNLTLPRNTLTVFTGVSGSGKSSLAFDTVFKEGQRRFVESLSAYARQFLGQTEKPRVEHVEGLSPTSYPRFCLGITSIPPAFLLETIGPHTCSV